MKNVFKKGLILGELLAVLAAVGFSKSGEGRQFTAELQKDLKTLAKHLKNDLHKLEDVTKEVFDDLVAAVVENYAKDKKIANDTKRALIAALRANWNKAEREYLSKKTKPNTLKATPNPKTKPATPAKKVAKKISTKKVVKKTK